MGMETTQLTLYTTRICPYCVAAKRLMAQKNIAYNEIDVSWDQTLRESMVNKTGWRTVPLILRGETLIGGYQELATMIRNGELDDLMTNSG